ncbi:CHRD domain-containing protein (plasmid) [Deinococcus metallilatus]|uniref:CHRD domain-containing protein n=1 Tax=Deinococcus metallilatus TaxID=1211322 RepID=A0AAJ5K020_9DEIO|nr:CHRD domain-containing protein [Deinococcus metallilatus]MBB5295640.1 hypothetical protein [Deinococcus metallilatus]QBY06899.1 CHRD domain-containing protein [Deinococcus metallilatus]TLK32289.1 CHRD domain-containing protein [Deinococcus metallilatus]GMA14169.1 hypothetical protein GCM10025871_05000 [Deinococcus metallilatus]
MNRLTLSTLAGLALTFTACGQLQMTTNYSVNLTGGTSGVALGTGQANLTLTGHTLTVLGTFNNLTTAATAAHLYGPGETESAASVSLALTIDQVTNGARSGRISGTFTLTDQQIAWLNNRQMYVDLHAGTTRISGVVERLLQ